MDAAGAQGLSSLLAAAPVELPPGVRERLDRRRLAHLVAGTRQLGTAAAVLADLGAAGLRVLPLKGAAVAELLYASVDERPMGDVDVLALDDAAGALRHLQGRGWTVVDPGDHATALRAPDRDDWLEIHRAWASCPGLHPLGVDELWAGRRVGAGHVRTVPSVEDLLLHAALHATFQHGLAVRLIQWVDVVRLARHTDLDVGRLAARAAATRTAGALALALAAAHELAGDVPLRVRFPLPAPLAAFARLEEPPAESYRGVARLRWALARGRRLALLRETVRGRGLAPGSTARRAARVARRLVLR